MVRDVDVITAIRTSIKAVTVNPPAMLLWAALIAASVAVGIVTFCIGLVVVFPLVGHATWHAFRDLVALDGQS